LDRFGFAIQRVQNSVRPAGSLVKAADVSKAASPLSTNDTCRCCGLAKELFQQEINVILCTRRLAGIQELDSFVIQRGHIGFARCSIARSACRMSVAAKRFHQRHATAAWI
jgi:hypothetical protein